MKLLPIEFGQEGRTLRQIKRSGKAAIYELSGTQGLLYGYEVVVIDAEKERERFGKTFIEREIYPSSSKFGKLGWSFGREHRKQAFEKFDILVQAEGEDSPPVTVPTVLAREFKHNRRLYTQLKREGQVALYKLSDAGYEVVVIQEGKAKEIKNYRYPDREIMPDVSQWGRFG